MKLNCAIIDDEPLAVELMAGYVRKTPFLTLCGSFGSGSAAFDMLRDRPVDLLFCDIQMPGLSGMELSRMLPADTRVIFTTAFSRYAVEGFRVNAVDYLLKPISYADFLAAANKALAWFELKNRAETPPPAAAPQSLFVKTEYRLRQIGFDSILYIEGLKDYVKIHVEEETHPVLTLTSLKSLEEQLPADRFVRVHRSFIVQPSKIRSIERNRIVFGKVCASRRRSSATATGSRTISKRVGQRPTRCRCRPSSTAITRCGSRYPTRAASRLHPTHPPCDNR